MSVVAKLHIQSITHHASYKGGGAVAKLKPVMRGDRNADWAQATPSGDVEVHLTDEEAQQMLGLLRTSQRLTTENREAVAAECPEGTDLATWLWENQPRIDRYPEVMLYLDAEPRAVDAAWRIERVLVVTSVKPAQWPRKNPETGEAETVTDKSQGSVEMERTGDAPYIQLQMYVNNPGAFEQFEAAQRYHATLIPSPDGYPGDGHAFRESAYPQGVYGWDKCGECSYGPEHHVTAA